MRRQRFQIGVATWLIGVKPNFCQSKWNHLNQWLGFVVSLCTDWRLLLQQQQQSFKAPLYMLCLLWVLIGSASSSWFLLLSQLKESWLVVESGRCRPIEKPIPFETACTGLGRGQGYPHGHIHQHIHIIFYFFEEKRHLNIIRGLGTVLFE